MANFSVWSLVVVDSGFSVISEGAGKVCISLAVAAVTVVGTSK